MTTPKATFAGLALIAALCAGFTLGLTAPAWAGPADCTPMLRGFLMFEPTFSDAFEEFDSGNCPKAFKLFKQWAERGNPNAQNNVGVFYESGQGVTRNDDIAEYWYRRAAEQGLPEAQFNLAAILASDLMLALQRGAAPNDAGQKEKRFIEAYMWVSLAAPHGHEEAAEGVKRLGKLMTPAQISEAQKLAREWKPKK